MKGEKTEAASPVECIWPYSMNVAFIHNYGCELIFILSFTGIPEPSDEECHEGSHFILYEKYCDSWRDGPTEACVDVHPLASEEQI